MNANVDGILRLFPAKTIAETTEHQAAANSLSGPMPLDAARKFWPDAFEPAFIQAIDGVRADPKWGLVWSGDLTAYGGDHSAADLAMCGELVRRRLTGLEIESAIRASGLYRPKWDRDDYRQATIAKAMGLLVNGATLPVVPTSTGPSKLGDGRMGFSDAAPASRDWLIHGLLLAGKSCVLAGLSGVSKTQIALLMASAVATGTAFGGRVTRQGRVLVVSGEEDRAELLRRVNAYIRHARMDALAQQVIRNGLRAFPLVGDDIRLSKPAGGALQETGFGAEIATAAKTIGDVRLIVLDHVGLLHGGDFNAKEDAALTMRLVNRIAQDTGAAVLVLAHSPKGAISHEKSDPTAVFGSTAFVEQARGALVLATMRPDEAKALGISELLRGDYVSLVGVKANYSSTGQTFWFRRTPFDEVGILEHVTLLPPTPAPQPTANLEANIIAAVRAAPGQYSKTRLREAFAGVTKRWKASKNEVEAAIERMLGAGQLINRRPTPAEISKFGHGPQVRAVLDIGGQP